MHRLPQAARVREEGSHAVSQLPRAGQRDRRRHASPRTTAAPIATRRTTCASTPAAACATCHKDVHSDHPKQPATAWAATIRIRRQISAKGVQVSACSSCHKFAAVRSRRARRRLRARAATSRTSSSLRSATWRPVQGCHAARVQQVVARTRGTKPVPAATTGLPHRPEPAKVGLQQLPSASRRPGQTRVTLAAPAATNRIPERKPRRVPAVIASSNRPRPRGTRSARIVTSRTRPTDAKSLRRLPPRGAAKRPRPAQQRLSDLPSCPRPERDVASVPACATCHQIQKLPGLHAEPKHRPCATCHSGHEDPAAPKREICVSCHKDRTDHFPQSPRCAGCHLFTKTP